MCRNTCLLPWLPLSSCGKFASFQVGNKVSIADADNSCEASGFLPTSAFLGAIASTYHCGLALRVHGQGSALPLCLPLDSLASVTLPAQAGLQALRHVTLLELMRHIAAGRC